MVARSEAIFSHCRDCTRSNISSTTSFMNTCDCVGSRGAPCTCGDDGGRDCWPGLGRDAGYAIVDTPHVVRLVLVNERLVLLNRR